MEQICRLISLVADIQIFIFQEISKTGAFLMLNNKSYLCKKLGSKSWSNPLITYPEHSKRIIKHFLCQILSQSLGVPT